MRVLEVGVAIGEDVIAARWNASELAITPSRGPTADALREARCELDRAIGTAHRIIASVAILPPLAQVKRIELPKMSEDDYRLAVATNAQRHFFGLGQSPVCGAVAIRPSKRGHDVPVLAFAVPLELIESIVIAFGDSAWTIDRIVPAQAAWVSDVMRRNPRLRRGEVSIGARLEREISVVEVETGSIKCVRRLRGSEDFQPIEPKRPWCLIGTGELDRSAAMMAAAAAKSPRRFEIVPDSARRARAARDRKVTRLFIVAACLNLVAAAISFRWRLDQQVALVAERRAAIRASVARALALQDSMRRLVERTTAVAELERTAPRWSAVLSRIVVSLPADAELSSIRAESDSVMLEGQSTDASRVVSALGRTDGVKSTRMRSPIVHEGLANETAAERWQLAVRVDRQAAARP